MTRNRLEQQIQKAIVGHLQWRARRGVWWTHIPLGGLRSKIEAAVLRGLGTTRGTPDLLLITQGKAHFLELKSAAGRVTPEQRACHEVLREAGAEVATAFSVDEALAQLEQWRLLRPNVSNQIAQAFNQLRHDVARRAARIRRTTESVQK
jgi:VRR-NUC domain